MNRLPPGPRFAPLQMLRFIRDGFGLYRELARVYGDPFTLPTMKGPLVVSGDPEGARQMFTADPEHLQVWEPDLLAPLIGKSSIIVANGERHRSLRKLISPPFNGARMRAYGGVMAQITAREMERWKPGVAFTAQESMQSISLEVILRTVFGLDGEDVGRFQRGMIDMIDTAHPLIMFYPSLRHGFGGVGPWARFRRSMDVLDGMIYELISRRRANPGGADILSLMLSARYDDGSAMSDEELRDMLLTLLVAGHETTAIMLSWALYRLHRNPYALTKFLSELDGLGNKKGDPEAIAELPYLDAICQETLRIDPVLPEVVRQVLVPFEFRGYTLPTGTAVGVSLSLVHMREDLYPDPRRFRPERFLERKFSPYEFFPFGGGTRRCLGSSFALYEMKIVLATILSTTRFGLVSDRPLGHERRNFALGPEGGVKMVVLKRV